MAPAGERVVQTCAAARDFVFPGYSRQRRGAAGAAAAAIAL
jgi:hypothetical protein